MIRLPFVLALLGALGACAAPNGGVRKLPPDIRPEPYQEPPRVEPSVGRLMVECSQHLQTWQELMAAPRSAENREKIDFTERSLATLVHREAETLRQQVVAGSPRNRGIACSVSWTDRR